MVDFKHKRHMDVTPLGEGREEEGVEEGGEQVKFAEDSKTETQQEVSEL